MKNLLCVLKKVPLFAGIREEELLGLLACLSAQEKKYARGEAVFLAGGRASSVGIVCSGGVQVIKEDFLGNRTILVELGGGELFGEAFSCAKIERLPVSVFAVADSVILFINYRKIITTCPNSCAFHARLIENMLGILAQKNMLLNQRIEILSKRTTRDKLISYLSAQMQAAGNRRFRIPFSRQELADFLCVDRSAMSAALGRMRDEGLLRAERSEFELLELESFQ